ncbi:Sensor histidine kinase RcsC [Paenibacillus solanacearum]|uniref:Circadian input-output histidine kinase CikA n=1 Tax=Paenibacillus solanacearum TaxID=2048548 RepID=A0A916NYG8_9BACL|nr:ATP-binding protein [Paenibacillus solanacearum]CAG7645016.1 Sensor histidine kinase RcsC [Paenibacillus solanacearum]
MLKRTLIVCLVGLISFMLIPLSTLMDHDKQRSDLRVRDGVMDLSAWNDEESRIIRLDGEWEFYWNRLLTADDFRQAGANEQAALMKVPSGWNGKTVHGQLLPAHGYATYRMVLKNVPAAGVFALKKTNIRFSSAVYANGQKLFEDGKPSGQASSYRAGNVPQIGFFSAEKGDVEIIVHVANFDYSNAGIPASIYFGEQAAMLALQQKAKAHELSTFAILAALALIYVICFMTAALYGKRDHSLLLFAVICLFYAMFNGLTGERVLLMYLPAISFETMFKVKDVCSMAGLIAVAILFYQLRKSMISLAFARFVVLVLSGYTVLIACLPIPVYLTVEPFVIAVYESMTIWLLVRTAALYIKSAEGDRLERFLLFAAILCLTLYAVDLILFSFSLKDNAWVGQFYIILFNMIVMVLVVLRFFEAYRTVNEMKDRLLQLDKIKDDFLSNTSHELKTPLSAIVTITDTLLKGVEGPVTAKQAQNLAIVAGSGRRLNELVNELLDYSKMKHGDITLYKTGTDLRAIVDSVIGIHSFLLGGKPIELVNRVPENMPAVYADGNRLVQILHNLLGNAIKFTERGTVEISADVVRDKVEVRVKDTGIGIAAHMRERIFQPFEQADASETRNYGGTGLGLSITKRLVELHGGDIRVDSVPGQGTLFAFTLLLAPASAMENTAARWEEPPARDMLPAYSEYPIYIQGEKNERVLVVDDDYANLQAMINLLRLDGYSIVVVNRGQLALEELAKWPGMFLVVLDVMMPDMSGYEVLSKVRERFSLFELPVLMLTAKNRSADAKWAMDNGANDFVGKPFEGEELMARVRSLTRLKASVKTAKDAEIAFLRSQIKPHFLYNALNSIATLCADDPHSAEELTLQLSQYLRGSFDFKQLDSLTTVDKEVELVEAYVNIEKARFGARLQVEYDVDACPDRRIPPLVVQPLVENAIRHGLMSKASGGKVTITVKKRANAAIRFTVEDNGCGMSDRKLKEVLLPDAERKGVGLWNISQRIKLLYGGSIHIESAEGIGTKVSFDIPGQPDKRGG